MSNILVVSTPSMAGLKKRILSHSDDGKLVDGDISWDTFEDGFPNLMIKNVESFRGKDVIFLADFLDLKDLFAQLAGTYL